MENLNNSKNVNYNFIAVPTQLFILLDYRLKLVLTSLIQVQSALANSQGWFFYSKEDLKKVCGIKNDKTIIACFETLYRLNILQVKSMTFQNNIGKRTANYYRINFNEIEKYNEYSVYECLNIPELQIAMLDYTSSDYKTTYTAQTESTIDTPTEVTSETSGNTPTIASNTSNEETTTNEETERSEAEKETRDIEATDTFGEDITDEWNSLVAESKKLDEQNAIDAEEMMSDRELLVDEYKEMMETEKKVPDEWFEQADNYLEQKRKEESQEPQDEFDFLESKEDTPKIETRKLEPFDPSSGKLDPFAAEAINEAYELREKKKKDEQSQKVMKVDGVETATVFSNVETEKAVAKPNITNIKENIQKACEALVNRFKAMEFENEEDCVNKMRQANKYINDKFNKGEIYLEDKDRLIREMVNHKLMKYRFRL